VHTHGEYVLSSDRPELVEAGARLYVKLDSSSLRLSQLEREAAEERDGIFVTVVHDAGGFKVAPGVTQKVTLTGRHPGGRTRPGTALPLGGQYLYRQAWHENRITFVVPDEAKTGVVTVECSQLAGSPLLQVSHDPTARIAVRMHQHRPMMTLDSSRSSDEDEPDKKSRESSGSGKSKPGASSKAGESDELTRHWTVEGVSRGNGKTIGAQLPARDAPYRIKLTVTDPAGHSDSTELRLLRLPASNFRFDKHKPLHPKELRAVHDSLVEAVEGQHPPAIELYGYADDPGTPAYNLKLSLKRDEAVLNRVLRHPPKKAETGKGSRQEKRQQSQGKNKLQVPIHELAYGETCQLVPDGGRQARNRRVDVLVLGPGVTVVPPKGCHPGRFKDARWKLHVSG
jgi:outer membrane protein OmpA-like peptidoglycan-associated protein